MSVKKKARCLLFVYLIVHLNDLLECIDWKPGKPHDALSTACCKIDLDNLIFVNNSLEILNKNKKKLY